jgi:hypothetical protein
MIGVTWCPDGKTKVSVGKGIDLEECKHIADAHSGHSLTVWERKNHYHHFARTTDEPYPRYEIDYTPIMPAFEPVLESTNSQISDMVFELVNALKFAGATSVSIHITLSDLNDEPIEEGAE